jgi:predicted ArsR family transcriptional regulator
MHADPKPSDPIAALATLSEPNRRRLYDLVVSNREPVGRDDAAAALGMSRELAAFHLDRLAEVGLLVAEYRRRSGRTGPGAGRPAKLYRRAAGDLSVSMPPRHYGRAADLLATALSRPGAEPAVDEVMAVARERGASVAREARQNVGRRATTRRLHAALVEALDRFGYEPAVDEPTGTVRLRNCPYDALAVEHQSLTCGMNLAWAEGVAEGLADAKLQPERVPRAETCCVEFRREARVREP